MSNMQGGNPLDVPSALTTKAFKPVEEIHNAAMQLNKDLSEMGAHKFADAFMSYTDAVATENADVREIIDQLRDKVQKQEHQIAVMERETDRNKVDIMTLIQWCHSLVGDVNLLKDLALGYRPAKTALAIQRELNDGRWAVYEGFCVIFKLYFDRESGLGKASNRTVEWPKFIAALDKLYQSHFVGGVQRISVFSTTHLSTFMTMSEHLDPIPVPFENFSRIKTNIFKDADSDEFLTQHFEFFLPAIIWAFIELKKAILSDANLIRSMQQQANTNQTVLNKFANPPLPLPFPDILEHIDVESCLQIGTAFSFRKDNAEWRDYYARAKGRSPPSSHMLLDEPSSSSVSVSGRPRSPPSHASLRGIGPEKDKFGLRQLVHGVGGVDFLRIIDTILEGQTLGGGQDDAPVVGGALQSVMLVASELLKGVMARKAQNEQTFKVVFRCLSVLTNKKLFKMSLLPSSELHRLTDDFVSRQHKYDEVLSDVLVRYSDLLPKDETVLLGGDAINGETKALPAAEWNEEGLKLATYLHDTENWLNSGALHIEQAVDELLVQTECPPDRDTDFAVLLTWLEGVIPAVNLNAKA